MQEFEREPVGMIASHVRYFRARRLVKRDDQHTIETLQAIQRDHVNYSQSNLQSLYRCQRPAGPRKDHQRHGDRPDGPGDAHSLG